MLQAGGAMQSEGASVIVFLLFHLCAYKNLSRIPPVIETTSRFAAALQFTNPSGKSVMEHDTSCKCFIEIYFSTPKATRPRGIQVTHIFRRS